MLILEHLPTIDLLSLSKAHKCFSNLVDDIFRKKFAKKMMILSILYPYDSPTVDFEETNEYILVEYEKTASKIIKKYGRSIRNLKIEFVSKSTYHAQAPFKGVYKLIQKHCAETLTEFHFQTMEDNFFDYVTVPFKNVHSITLENDVIGLGNDQLNLQQMFPSLRNLYLNNVKIQKIKQIQLEFPHLEHLHAVIDEAGYPGAISESLIAGLIMMNPQIKSISMQNINTNMLQFISNALPSLKKLKFDSFIERDPILIHFEHVESVQIERCHGQSMPSNISFGENLVEFVSNAQTNDHKYIDFILNNRNLKKIRISSVENDDIQRLTSANLNVVEMSMNCGSNIEAENLVKLIEISKKLNQLNLIMFGPHEYMEGVVQTLKTELKNEWIVNVDKRTISIVRKCRLVEL